jgi:hypothetical protein
MIMNPRGSAFDRVRGGGRGVRCAAVVALLVLGVGREASAQLDPLLLIKRKNAEPNLLIAVDTSARMQSDAENLYRDPTVYNRIPAPFEESLGMSVLTSTVRQYRRKFANLAVTDPAINPNEKYEATRITVTTDLDGTAFTEFDKLTRLGVARTALTEAIARNVSAARFGLLKMRQRNARIAVPTETVKVTDPGQQIADAGNNGKWFATTTTADSTNATADPASAVVIQPDSGVVGGLTANQRIIGRLSLPVGAANALTPAGRESAFVVDAPIDNMLDDLRTEAQRLLGLDANTVCRNTVAVLVVGGGEGSTSGEDPAAKASQFLNVLGHRVPVYVIAIAPNPADVGPLTAIATNSGGVFTEITAAMINATTPGQPVPELVRAVNLAVQHAYASQTDLDTAPSVNLPTGPYTEFQVTSPIVGTVDLHNAPTLDPMQPNITDGRIENDGQVIPQRSNVLITTGFRLPGFEGRLRAYRMYRPVSDSTAKSGFKFVADGTRLWESRVPDAARRNIYTALPDGTIVPFRVESAGVLSEYLQATDVPGLIDFVRNQPLGAILSSTPALMDPPSLDPPPDATYPGFADENKNRRALVWVAANDGMIHALDARLGVEVWAFIPFNLLPKLKTLRSGQPVGDFRYFVDSSPKIADVKVAGRWRTFLIMGEGAGGTFYQTFDVTLDDIDSAVTPTDNNIDVVLGYFARPDSVELQWTFPRYSSFDWRLAPWGDIAASAPLVEKTVGETWSDPAVGQIENAGGRFAVLTGSGFFKHSSQLAANRGGTVAGTTFYLLDIETGSVFDSRNIGSDGNAETVDNCAVANNCEQLKNALQADPVATGPTNSRFINKVYVGDLDGRLWRFDIRNNLANIPTIVAATNLLAGNSSPAGPAHPMFASMATVNVGGTRQYLFQGTGSDLLPTNGVNEAYKLLIVLDNGPSGTATALSLLSTDGVNGDEQVTFAPAVAGDIVFFTTTTTYPAEPCRVPTGTLYAITFIGGPAYDTNNDGRATNTDSTKVKTTTGRATAPFIADQHLVFGAGNKVEMFGDPNDFNNGVGQVGVRILSWREVR